MPERLEGRNGQIWKRYLGGWTQERIAAEFELDQTRVSQIISQVRASIPAETKESQLKDAEDFLREIREAAMDLARAPLPPAVNNKGNVIVDPVTGEIVRDATGRLQALAAAERFHDRTVRLLGLEAPKKLDVSVSSDEERATQERAAESLARLHGDE